MKASETEYWRKHYNDPEIVTGKSLQKNVHRTKGGDPISEECWKQTIDYIRATIGLQNEDTVIELCCGNGMVIGELSTQCKKAIGVDFSSKLLSQLIAHYGDTVEGILLDVLNASFPRASADIVIIYSSIQYFNEYETICLLKNAISWLNNGGRLFIGDIPNEAKKWEFINLPEHRRDYILRTLECRPLIGHWFQPEFFDAVSRYMDCTKINILQQPDYLLDASFRFDVLFTKEKV